MNARIFYSQPGEEAIIGHHIFHVPQAVTTPDSNRDLLCELCFAAKLMLTNSFFERPTDETVTYFGLTSNPMDEIFVNGFAELDHILAQPVWLDKILCIRNVRKAALQSYYFLVLV